MAASSSSGPMNLGTLANMSNHWSRSSSDSTCSNNSKQSTSFSQSNLVRSSAAATTICRTLSMSRMSRAMASGFGSTPLSSRFEKRLNTTAADGVDPQAAPSAAAGAPSIRFTYVSSTSLAYTSTRPAAESASISSPSPSCGSASVRTAHMSLPKAAGVSTTDCRCSYAMAAMRSRSSSSLTRISARERRMLMYMWGGTSADRSARQRTADCARASTSGSASSLWCCMDPVRLAASPCRVIITSTILKVDTFCKTAPVSFCSSAWSMWSSFPYPQMTCDSCLAVYRSSCHTISSAMALNTCACGMSAAAKAHATWAGCVVRYFLLSTAARPSARKTSRSK
mmetsp:Transcript_19190/g.55038  ORF Transcript_19190/g.55038 Transcript_19190/m.55038 type:complete len:340 (-) Transcript_19190:1277-2296(-)